MKVVIDTNVFVSSFLGGNPRNVVDLWKDGKITLCLSRAILDEYVQVLQTIGLEYEIEMEELLSLFARGVNLLFTSRTPRIRAVHGDAGDDKFIECAVALKAQAIVTGDKALRALGNYMGIGIHTPREFLTSCLK